MAQQKAVTPRTVRAIPPLPGGLVQHREGIERCGGCQGEVVIGRTIDGILVDLTVVRGDRHSCVGGENP